MSLPIEIAASPPALVDGVPPLRSQHAAVEFDVDRDSFLLMNYAASTDAMMFVAGVELEQDGAGAVGGLQDYRTTRDALGYGLR